MASVTDSKLKLLSMNVRGLRNAKKRRALFYSFKKGKYDVIGLQETHLTKADKETISKEWGPNFYISEGSSNSKGLLIYLVNLFILKTQVYYWKITDAFSF